MAAFSASLPWLESTKSQIQNLQIWKEFSSRLHDAVQQQMNESSIKQFTDLSESEKVFVLEKAAKALQTGDVYNKVSTHISSCLEENLYSSVAHEVQDSDVPKNQSALVTRHIYDGVVNILEKRPSLKLKLRVLFNQPLPTSIRNLVWKLQLSNTKARMEYLKQLSMNKARSMLDRDISLQCQDILTKVHAFQHLKANNSVLRTMRNVLSYYHKLQHMEGSLPEPEYLLLLPLVQVALDSNPRTSLDSSSTQLVEEYVAFMDYRPSIMHRPHTPEVSLRSDGLFKEMAQLLKNIAQNLAHTIENIYSSLAKTPEEALQVGLTKMLQPVIQVLFVGYLNMNTLLYVWDQYILGLNEPVYNCLSAFSLAFLILMHDRLSTCISHHELETVIKTQGPALSVDEFQIVIDKYFYSELFSQLNREGSSPLPVHDPTQATPLWSHISKTTDPQRKRPQDRRQVREERELLRKQVAERQKTEEKIQRLREQEQKKQEEERLNRLLEDTKKRFDAQKAHLEKELMQERQQSYEKQKLAEAQISELQGQIRRLMQQRPTSAGGYSMESLIAPPPSANSQAPNETPHIAPPASPEQQAATTVKEVNGKTSNSVALDLLKQIMESADSIVNGQSFAERDTLNAIMERHLKEYREDVKNSEIEILGHELDTNELDRVQEPQRSAIARRLTLAVQRKTEARYAASLKSRERFPES
ncbi:hypothetical protein XENTR_v10005072 [Xenopus tropicalis]|uniref:Uncharacterized protein LOC101734873 n=1 Tax=Xenopus tropicalis TaxID=8364 RepID=A0A8J0SRF8_XENTR|nr:uncharacterized protein LOC101734873 [Xenopus tropicalis]KAE8622035.1 hypothetical protein XENTR_v10005072 [Xenopus tropicalis]|eukprot:XP_017946936.1 PREDICTED: uncharacterized protein LOC101734873 [Xenopus tropicalis]